jgi:single-strand DNA-binding protein
MTMSRDAAAVTLVGRAGTHPQISGNSPDRVSLRIITTERWFDKATNVWVDGDEFGVTVVCWKGLGGAVLKTVRKGDPIIVTGRITTRRFEKDGATAYFTEVKADVVGLDVARMGARFARVAFEPRETTDAAEGTDLAAPADGQQSDLPEPGVDGERPADWDDPQQPTDHGLLVSVD